MGSAIFRPEEEDLKSFLDKNKPSETTRPPWIHVSTPRPAAREVIAKDRDLSFLDLEFEGLKSSNRVTSETVKELATEFKFTSGKWLVYLSSDVVDEYWAKIAEAVMANKLGMSAKMKPTAATLSNKQLGIFYMHFPTDRTTHTTAFDNPVAQAADGFTEKVSARKSDTQHVVCIYTNDFTDEDDVMRVEQQLRQLGVTGRLTYKPDIYTQLGIYSGNQWNVKPTVYTTYSSPQKNAGPSKNQPQNTRLPKNQPTIAMLFKKNTGRPSEEKGESSSPKKLKL